MSENEKKEEAPSLGGRSFLADEEIRNLVYEGKGGYMVRVCLTSYRSLPLSCLDKIELSIDGKLIDPNKMLFVLNGYSHKLNELPKLHHLFWFILDYADLFVESKEPLPPGEHLVEAMLVTVEPYMTGGRHAFFSPATKRLAVAQDL
jgi:hypothetical protein